MKNLPSPVLQIINPTTNKSSLLRMPNSPLFWKDGELMSIDETIESLKSKLKEGAEIRHLNLGEAFELEIAKDLKDEMAVYTNDEKGFDFWLRVMLDCSFSVTEEIYVMWYKNLNSGKETVFMSF